jgi:NAD dependent epimerase/dehydratase family enzyme
MKVAITGASGLVGTAVSRRLEEAGHQVTRVVRSREAAREPDAVYWKPASGEIDAAGIAGHDAVINLAGENIFGIWTDAKKRRIRESRVKGTTLSPSWIRPSVRACSSTRRASTTTASDPRTSR